MPLAWGGERASFEPSTIAREFFNPDRMVECRLPLGKPRAWADHPVVNPVALGSEASVPSERNCSIIRWLQSSG